MGELKTTVLNVLGKDVQHACYKDARIKDLEKDAETQDARVNDLEIMLAMSQAEEVRLGGCVRDSAARIKELEEALLAEADEWERVVWAFPAGDSRQSEVRLRAVHLRALAGKGDDRG